LKKKKSDFNAFLYENEKGKIIPLDDIAIDIMKSMLDDATVLDSALSTKLNLSDANIQHRRKTLEDQFLTRKYLLDVSKLGWRIGDIQVDVGEGKSEELAEQIFRMFANILDVSLRVNSTASVSARIFYRDNEELASIIDKIKRLPFVKDVAFSEIIKMVRARSIGTMKDVFANRRRH
jgi:DNA-binding Lrp family transcriptional regulator